MSACERCQAAEARVKAILVDLENAEVEMRAQRREIGRLKREIQRQAQPAELDEKAERVFLHWRDKCRPSSKRKVVFGEKRKTKVMARLRDGYTVEDLCLAINGAAKAAFVDEKGKRFDDLELICRDEVKVDLFIARGEESQAPTVAATPKVLSRDQIRLKITHKLNEEYPGRLREDKLMEWVTSPCPSCKAHEQDEYGLYSPLKVSTNGRTPMVWCDVCSITTEDLLEATTT